MTAEPLLYAIGDIHGRDDLLAELLGMVAADAEGELHRLVFLGDYLDRGPRSRQVVERLLTLNLTAALAPVFLCGNHEDLWLNLLARDDPRLLLDLTQAKSHGMAATLRSYGLAAPQTVDEAAATLHDLRQAMPPAHRSFLSGLRDSYETSDCFFSHAGIDPALPLARQTRPVLLHGTSQFLQSCAAYPKYVVHGHWRTRSYMPEVHGRRIALDTGAELTGNLAAARLQAGRPARFLMTCAY